MTYKLVNTAPVYEQTVASSVVPGFRPESTGPIYAPASVYGKQSTTSTAKPSKSACSTRIGYSHKSRSVTSTYSKSAASPAASPSRTFTGSAVSKIAEPISVDTLATLLSSFKADSSPSDACACIEASSACTTAVSSSVITATATVTLTTSVVRTSTTVRSTTVTTTSTTTTTAGLIFALTTTISVTVTPPASTLTSTRTTTTTTIAPEPTCSNGVAGGSRHRPINTDRDAANIRDAPACARYCKTVPGALASLNFDRQCFCYDHSTSEGVNSLPNSILIFYDLSNCT